MKQYKLTVINLETNDSGMESGISALILTMRNKYGINTSKQSVLKSIKTTGCFRSLSSDSKHLVELKEVPKAKIQERKRLNKIVESTTKLQRKYRNLYEKCLLNNDRETGAVALYYCEKTRYALRLAFCNWVGSLS